MEIFKQQRNMNKVVGYLPLTNIYGNSARKSHMQKSCHHPRKYEAAPELGIGQWERNRGVRSQCEWFSTGRTITSPF